MPVTEADLQAYVDEQLPAARRGEVEAWLAENPVEQARIADYRRQNALLRTRFDGVLEEPVPERLAVAGRPRTRPLLRMAAAVAWLAIGVSLGWFLRGAGPAGVPVAASPAFVREAAIAHVVYAPEVRHPVEVAAAEQDHLVKWLSKRLGASLKIPYLEPLGYGLVGGRLLPGSGGPVAQFMYQDRGGQRLTLYVRTDAGEARETAFRFAREGDVRVFYWIDGSFGYALSGEIERAQLLKIAEAVYRELNP
jgi:anti-sigma factor RsiW